MLNGSGKVLFLDRRKGQNEADTRKGVGAWIPQNVAKLVIGIQIDVLVEVRNSTVVVPQVSFDEGP